jgi:hypothetical protein
MGRLSIPVKVRALRIPLDKSGECWLWLGQRHKRDGYGLIKGTTNQPLRAHRVFYTIFNGEIPEGMVVCHSCDTPACVNPDHLWVGTHADNQRDKTQKGRHPNTLKTHCKRGHELSGKNLYINTKKQRCCRTCIKASQVRFVLRKKNGGV